MKDYRIPPEVLRLAAIGMQLQAERMRKVVEAARKARTIIRHNYRV